MPDSSVRSLLPPRKRGLVSSRLRLALAVAAAVAVTGLGAGALAVKLARQTLADEVHGIATRTVEYAASGMHGFSSPDPDELNEYLRSMEGSIGEVEALAVVVEESGQAQVLASTGQIIPAPDLALALDAIRQNRTVTRDSEETIRIAAPVRWAQGPPAAVVGRANLGAIMALQQRAFQAVLWFALVAIVLIVVLIDLLAWRLVYKPIRQIRDTIARVSEGDLAARVPVARRDEIGQVADGLNDLLDRGENFNETMQARVREATGELEQRNQQLTESYNRLFGLREQLARAEQLASVGQTAANVAHQVGTPLNLISGYVQLLKEDVGPDSPYAPRLAIIEEQIEKVTSTVRTLLDRSRQMGRKTRTTAGDLVARVVEVMRPSFEASGIEYEIERPDEDIPILVDATNFELALLNLMNNAVHAMPNGGSLHVRVAAAPGNRVRIEIADTGHGIPEDLIPRIFDPWVSTKKPGHGTGLGLPIARDVVMAHGGTISVDSSVGKGTAFTIELPSDAGRGAIREAGRVAS